MKFTTAGCALVIGVLLSTPCLAGPSVTVHTLLTNCRAQKTSAEWGYCVGYITGIGDEMADFGLQRTPYGDGTTPRPRESLCPDQHRATNFDATVTVPLFVNWAEHHPEQLQFPASEGVSFALQTKWPCQFSH